MAITDRKPILVKFPIGSSLGKAKHPVLSDAFVVHSEQGTREGEIDKREYGVTFDYDKAILVNANQITRNINQETVFFVEEMPTCNNEYGDYVFAGKSDEVEGRFKIYLRKSQKNTLPYLYYQHHSGIICSYQLNFDKKALVAYVPKDRFMPFNHNNKIWTKPPVDENDTNNRIVFKNQEIVGFTERSMSHNKITFEAYGEL